jgi:ATP-dependent Clp protease ATP-binding subunit ClpC
MWGKLTERAKQAMYQAQGEADRLGENLVKPEHLLLGILRGGDTAANRLLYDLGVSPEEIARRTEAILPLGPGRDGEQLRLDPRVREIIERAETEAALLGNRFVGPEHLLLALIAVPSGATGAVFQHFGPDLETARAKMNARLGTHPHGAVLAQTRIQAASGATRPLHWVLFFLVFFVMMFWLLLMLLR